MSFKELPSLYHHRMELINFLDNYKDKLNVKLEMALHDAESIEIGAPLGAIHRSQFPMW